MIIIIAAIGFIVSPACQKEADNYERDTMKAKQIEAKINLEALATAELGYRAMANKYSASFGEMGFSVSGEDQRYSYFIGQDVLKGARGPDKLPESLEPAMVTQNSFVAYAIANLDADPDLDIWTVNQNRQVVHVRDDLL